MIVVVLFPHLIGSTPRAADVRPLAVADARRGSRRDQCSPGGGRRPWCSRVMPGSRSGGSPSAGGASLRAAAGLRAAGADVRPAARALPRAARRSSSQPCSPSSSARSSDRGPGAVVSCRPSPWCSPPATDQFYRQRVIGFAWGCCCGGAGVRQSPRSLCCRGPASSSRASQPAHEMGGSSATPSSAAPAGRCDRRRRAAAGLADRARGAPRSEPLDFVSPARTPWVQVRTRSGGGGRSWCGRRSTRPAATPPESWRAFRTFPWLPRAFAHMVQGRLPLLRVGWGMLRPAALGQVPQIEPAK